VVAIADGGLFALIFDWPYTQPSPFQLTIPFLLAFSPNPMLIYISKMKTRVNCYDITRAAGVSQTVVSLVFNGKADKYRISKATQERVRAAIRQYGYTPSMSVRDMFLKRRKAIEIDGAATDPAGLKAAVEPGLNAAGSQFQTITLSTETGHRACADHRPAELRQGDVDHAFA